ERAAQVPAVLIDDRCVRVADARVDVGDDDSLPAVVEARPDLRSVDRVQAPLRRLRTAGRSADRLRDRVGVCRADLLYVRARGDCVESGPAGGGDMDCVDDPERLVADAT